VNFCNVVGKNVYRYFSAISATFSPTFLSANQFFLLLLLSFFADFSAIWLQWSVPKLEGCSGPLLPGLGKVFPSLLCYKNSFWELKEVLFLLFPLNKFVLHTRNGQAHHFFGSTTAIPQLEGSTSAIAIQQRNVAPQQQLRNRDFC
jgi:hypothetical protein